VRERARVAWALVFVHALVARLAYAQSEKQVEHNAQVWVSLNGTIRASDGWGAVADFHLRRDEFLAEPSFYFVRLGANRWVGEKLTLTLGYAHMWLPPAEDGWQTWSHENRIYQQVQYLSGGGRLVVLQRLRNEQRWRQQVVNDVKTGENDFSDRVRYLLGFTLPVAAKPVPLGLVLSDEVLLQFGSRVVPDTFDQNRLFGGVKVSLARNWSFDLGYMQVYQQQPDHYDLNHTLRWFFYWTPDLRDGRSWDRQPVGGEE